MHALCIQIYVQGLRFNFVAVIFLTKGEKKKNHVTIVLINGKGPSLVAQMVKRLSAMLEIWVRSLGRENPLEKEMATHSRTLVWKIPWTEKPGRLQSMGSQRVRHY